MWNVASWDKDSAGKLPNQKLLSKVGSFAIYVNDNDNELQNNAGRPRTGDLVFDSIKSSANAIRMCRRRSLPSRPTPS